jgi:hypothetical protein
MAGGQICFGTNLAEEYRNGGSCYDGFRAIKAEGLVEKFTAEIWPWTSDILLEGLNTGKPIGLIDAYSFYLNPLQRFVSNELWDLLVRGNMKIVAIRAIGGGAVHSIRDNPHQPEYLRKRAAEVAPLYERSGCGSWTEFCMRFAFGVPNLIATIGATTREPNLKDFVDESQSPAPLPADIQDEIYRLHYRWADEHDRFAEPWSM